MNRLEMGGFLDTLPRHERDIPGKPKAGVFISGSGTNLQRLIDLSQAGLLRAEIPVVVSNKPGVLGLTRAERANIPTEVIAFNDELLTDERKLDLDTRLVDTIDRNGLDMVVLAGYMGILRRRVLQAAVDRQIPILNLHPALLTPDNAATIMTSRGEIPVIRGAHAIQDAFDQQLPVSGVTVHQILPGNPVDTGPIVLQREVTRGDDETPDSWEAKIHKTEYEVLPKAVNTVARALKQGYDASQGTLPWKEFAAF